MKYTKNGLLKTVYDNTKKRSNKKKGQWAWQRAKLGCCWLIKMKSRKDERSNFLKFWIAQSPEETGEFEENEEIPDPEIAVDAL